MNDQRRGRGRGRGRGKFNDNANQSFGQEPKRPGSLTPSSKPFRQNNERGFVAEESKTLSVGPLTSNPNGKKKDLRPQQYSNQLHVSSSLVSYSSEFAPHPGYGTAGRPIGLVSNYFSLICKYSKVYHYNVSVVCPDKKEKPRNNYKTETKSSNIEQQLKSNVGRKERQEVMYQLLKSKDFVKFELQKSMPIYDGCSNIYTSSELPPALMSMLEEYFLKAVVNDKERRYVVCVQKVKKDDGSNIINLDVLKNLKKLNLNDLSSDVLLALNAIMNHRGPESREIRVGRSFFSVSQANKTSIGEGLEIWRGYNQTIHLTDSGPVMISNLSAKIFHKAGPAIEYINEVLNRDIRQNGRLSEFEVTKITQALKGVKVYATHSKYRRKYTINDDYKKETVSRFPANELYMNIDGERITNAEYFKRNYSPLKFPYLHCFRMRSTTNTFIPFENCEIMENQPRLDRNDIDHNLPPRLASRMIRETAVPPVRRFQQIENHVSEVGRECKLQMSNFGLSLNMKPKHIEGRVIDPPTINYKDFPRSQPNDCGTWMMRGHFIKALRVESWCVLNFDRRCQQRDLARFSEKLVGVAYLYGLILSKDYEIVPDAQLKSLDRVKNSELVVIILPKDRNNYNEIKLKADCELRLVSQCILSDVLRNVLDKNDNRTVTNICLKINVKLGGVNHQLASRNMVFGLKIFFPEPVIVFGADAVHSLNFPSISSVVGSLDAFPSKYKVCCRVQENPNEERKSQELILHLQSMVEIILREFKVNAENKYPEKIIFFRDGVSEGQFRAVLQKEVLAIQKAAKEVFGFLIKITFIIVQKRHQTRLMPQNPKQAAGREGNVPAGTVVDKDITYPNAFDYFLCSHEGIKGTSKPARYTVLYDDNNFSADELQSLTFHLCHTFARCNRSVSIPAPVKYADLAAYRAKKYADLDYMKWRNDRRPDRPKSYQMSRYVKDAIDNMHENKNQMFFI